LQAALRAPARSSRLLVPAGEGRVSELVVSPAGKARRDRRSLDRRNLRNRAGPQLLACGRRSALVALTPPRLDESAALELMGRRFSLTRAEARVTAALAAGATVAQITRRHGVRASTVRAQLRSIFEKTGVNRQSELVRLALTGRLAEEAHSGAHPGTGLTEVAGARAGL